MPVLAMALVIPISILLVGLAATLLTQPDSPIPPAIQARFDRHDELSRAWVEFVADNGRAPTTSELWAAAPPTLDEA